MRYPHATCLPLPLLLVLARRYGAVESARLRSIPIKADAKMPRRAAVASGNVDAARGSLHAYIVFEDPSAAEAALAHNMQEFEGNHLRVDFAGANKLKLQAARKKGGAAAVAAGGGRDVRYDPARTVFVGNLHLEAEVSCILKFRCPQIWWQTVYSCVQFACAESRRTSAACLPACTIRCALPEQRFAVLTAAVFFLAYSVSMFVCPNTSHPHPALTLEWLCVQDEDVIRFFVTGVGGGAASEVEAVRVVRDQKTSMGKGGMGVVSLYRQY